MEGGTRARTPYTPEHFDEAIDPDGEPRSVYAALLPALEELDLGEAESEIKAHLKLQGIDFKGDEGPEDFLLDLVPRVLDRDQWEELEAGLRQRARALNAFVRDAYFEQRIVREGVVPARVIETSENLEPEMVGIEIPGIHAPVFGFDVVRGVDGRFRILEDNCMNPSGSPTRSRPARPSIPSCRCSRPASAATSPTPSISSARYSPRPRPMATPTSQWP